MKPLFSLSVPATNEDDGHVPEVEVNHQTSCRSRKSITIPHTGCYHHRVIEEDCILLALYKGSEHHRKDQSYDKKKTCNEFFNAYEKVTK